jgi:hypothetical protein
MSGSISNIIATRNKVGVPRKQTLTLKELSDIRLSHLANGQTLQYDETLAMWVNADSTSGAYGNIDGGTATSVFGGLDPIYGGNA